MSVRRILLIAYYFPPLGGVGSQRAISFARHLPVHGFLPVVVTPRRGAYALDTSLDPGSLPGVEVVRTRTLEPAVLLSQLRGGRGAGADMVQERRAGGAIGALRRVAHSALYYPDHGNGWIPFAQRAAVAAGRRHGACAVVSTSPPVSAHVAALRAARKLGVPAVLDFRDLWTPHRPAGARGRRLEERLLRDAAAVTTVSDACRDWLAERVPDVPGERFHVLRNGFEDADFADPAPAAGAGVFRIVHAGTIYGRRQDPAAFFRALAALRAAGAFGELRPEVVLAGKVDPYTLGVIESTGCADIVDRRGFVSHPEAIRLQRSATVNLLLTWSVPGVVAAGVCPGKMYEQLAAGRPILALALAESEAARLLEEVGGALVARPDDEEGIRAALGRLVSSARNGDAAAAVPPRRADLSRFSRSSVASELAGLLASLVA